MVRPRSTASRRCSPSARWLIGASVALIAIAVVVALVGPFVRNPPANPALTLMTRVAMAPLWAAASWNAYPPNLYAGRKPDDFDDYRRQISASMRRPGYARAFSRTTRTTHAPAEASLPQVHTPTLLVMGDKDPDFRDAKVEAEWVAAALHGEVAMIPNAGHYPHAQQPDAVLAALLPFMDQVRSRA